MQSTKATDAHTYSCLLLKCEQSQAYSTFCERLYGKDLCQIGLATMVQVDKLLAVLNLDARSRVLDLGCGIGRIAEYVSDVTGAAVTGVDFARGAIERARARTAGKRDRLAFELADMDDLPFPTGCFDAILAIDAMQFIGNRFLVVLKMKQILRRGGQMGYLWTQWVEPGVSRECLQPEHTDLAMVLDGARLEYRFWDLTEDACGFLRRYAGVAEALKPAFQAEGNDELYRLKADEGQQVAKYAQEGRVSRYLYHVVL